MPSSSFSLEAFNPSTSNEGPTHVLEFSDQVVNLELSPYFWSYDLLCIAFKNKITVASIKFKEEHKDLESNLCFKSIEEFSCTSRVDCISWSPEATLHNVPQLLLFACATSDFKINIYNSNVVDAFTTKTLSDHQNHVNDVAFNPSGDYIASTSSDCTCRVWSVKDNYSHLCKFYLRSPGMSLKWHKDDDTGKLLVGESLGTVTLFNVASGTAVLSFHSRHSPLLKIDWAPTNYMNLAAATASSHILLWHLTNPSMASCEKNCQGGPIKALKFVPSSDHKVVTLGSSDGALKVTHLQKPLPLTLANIKLATAMSCHHHLPFVFVASDHYIQIFRIP